jgi:hypothetical protein
MVDFASDKLRGAFKALLRPAVQLLMKRGLGAKEILKLIREVLIDAAEDEIRKVSSKVNASRISVITGINRHEVREILDARESAGKAAPPPVGETLAAKIISQWEQNRRFASKPGKPRKLSFQGAGSEFFELVESVNGGINPATVLFELERRKIVQKDGETVELIRQVNPPAEEESQLLLLLARDLQALVESVEQNISPNKPGIGNLHIRTEFDGIYASHIPEIRKWLIDEGRASQQRVRNYLAMFDRDLNPQTTENSDPFMRVVFTNFSFIAGETAAEAVPSPKK